MKLLLDAGNSRLKWALLRDGALADFGAAAHHGTPARAFAAQRWPKPDAVWIASVMGAGPDAALAAQVKETFGAAPDFARVEDGRNGLKLAYAEPARLGVDRWLQMQALWSEQREAFCVAAAGTALTFDEVDGSGHHQGGLIGAGLRAQEAAVRGSTRFALGEALDYRGRLGTDTESCVHEAALFAALGLVERAARRFTGRKILSGGDAPVLLRHLAGWSHRPHLVLEGLKVIACSS